MAVFQLMFALFLSALQPTAVLLTPEWFKSASSPRKVLKLTASQPSSQAARACGESAEHASTSGMRTPATAPNRPDRRLVEFLVDEVFVFIKEPFCSPDWLILPLQV